MVQLNHNTYAGNAERQHTCLCFGGTFFPATASSSSDPNLPSASNSESANEMALRLSHEEDD
jgi:hypothetical protein